MFVRSPPLSVVLGPHSFYLWIIIISSPLVASSSVTGQRPTDQKVFNVKRSAPPVGIKTEPPASG